MNTNAPDEIDIFYEEIAAVNRFRLAEEENSEFYQRHWQPITFATTIVCGFHGERTELKLLMSMSAGNDVYQVARSLREAFQRHSFSEKEWQWNFDNLTPALWALRRIIDDEDLPTWLHCCRPIIHRAFVDKTTQQGETS